MSRHDDKNTTGHEWDGIREYDRSLPAWWLWILIATIVWAIGYWIAMPAWPLLDDYTRGVLGYSQRDTVRAQLAAAREAQAAVSNRIAQASLEQIRTDPEMQEFALAGGRSAFLVNCAQCHGQGAQGARGFPNLNDDDWLWGGTPEAIQATIRFGVRSGHADGRESQMPAFGRDQLLTRAQIADLAEYVVSLSDGAHDAAAAARAKPLFAEQCASCHGENGRGKAEFGAPNLADAIWLYGGDRASLLNTIANARGGVMPAWEARLDPVTIKKLAVYVHSLGGGQ